MGVNKLFDRGAALRPDAPCLIADDLSRSYRDVAQRRLRIADAIADDTFAPGDKCAVYSPNCVSAFECILGIYRANGVFVPLNPKNPASDSIFVINHCDVTIVFFHSSLARDVELIRKECPRIRRYICIDTEVEGMPSLERWIADATDAPPDIDPRVDRLVSIYSTGGTTGRPKGVMFTPLTWEIMAANMLEAIPQGRPPVYLAVAPMTHAAGTIAILMMARGATTVIHDHFDAAEVLQAIEQHRVTHLYLPPTAIYMLLAHADVRKYDYSSLECFIYTSAPMSVSKLKSCLDIFGPVMVQFWGQTEAPIFCTALLQSDHAAAIAARDDAHLASCGRPMLLTPVEVMDDNGRLLPQGERGELVVRGNLVMAGYYKDASATEEASKYGWHHTGDVGFKDADGFVYIVDRKKDMIISGGFNVYPAEVEQVVMTLPEIQDCAVIGAPDEKWGEAVTAIVELRTGCAVDPQLILALCKRELGAVKTPKSVQFWDSLPRTSVGKIDKKKIRSGFWEGRSRAI
jgi:acyl-CoA synthetase (AMP-forming)/AMP-acid ligase II